MRIPTLPVALTAILLHAPASWGAVLAYDPFNGVAGNTLDGANGGVGWTTAWASNFTSQVNFSAQGLSYSNGQIAINGGSSALLISGPAGANGDLIANREFASQTGTVYFSFLFRTSTSAGVNDDFAQFGLDANNVNPRVSVGQTGTGTTGITEFFARSGTSSSSFTGIDTFNDETYFVVARVTKSAGNYGKVDLFFNPSTLTEPGSPSATVTLSTSGFTSLDTFVMRMARLEGSDSYLIDELRVTTTYAEAIGLPEPASLTMFALSAAGMAIYSWRRRRTLV